MPDLNEPDVQDAALAFGLLCVIIAAIGGGLSDEPAAAFKADGLLALLATLYLVMRGAPRESPGADFLPILVRPAAVHRRAAITPRLYAHLWFAQWMAALAAVSLTVSMFTG